MNRLIRVYFLPGAVMQSIMVGGGYGTGREISEYFTQYGMGGGALGLLIVAGAIAVIFALSLDIARRFQVYDYRRFSRVLLGRGWFLYDFLAIGLAVIVIAVITSAAGTILRDELGVNPLLGGVVIVAAVLPLIYFGRSWVTTILAFWSVLLYATMVAYLIGVFLSLPVTDAAMRYEIVDGWLGSGLLYTGYNIAAIPICLYAAMAIESRREAIAAGVIGAFIAVLPAAMMHVSFGVDYPRIVAAELPVYSVLGLLSLPWLRVAYLVVIVGTFIETAAGSVQGFVERVDGALFERRGRSLGRWGHVLVAVAILIPPVILSTAGIVALVARGYGTIAWGFILFYIVPLLTVGTYKLFVAPVASEAD